MKNGGLLDNGGRASDLISGGRASDLISSIENQNKIIQKSFTGDFF